MVRLQIVGMFYDKEPIILHVVYSMWLMIVAQGGRASAVIVLMISIQGNLCHSYAVMMKHKQYYRLHTDYPMSPMLTADMSY